MTAELIRSVLAERVGRIRTSAKRVFGSFTKHPVRWGEARDERSQLQNKRLALRRMAATPTFQLWVRKQLGRNDLIRAQVEREMWPVHIKTEIQDAGKWVEVNGSLTP